MDLITDNIGIKLSTILILLAALPALTKASIAISAMEWQSDKVEELYSRVMDNFLATTNSTHARPTHLA